MDSLTHIALGACMGEAFAGGKLGKKAMLWGALAQTIPDIDFVAAFWQDTASNLLTHRGFTHSIIFCVAIAFILALLAEKWHRPHNISFTRWSFFFGVVILTHIFLDAFNNYGVGWFEPFSHYRLSFNVIYVADPFFSIAPGIALLMLILIRRTSKKRNFWWKTGLGIAGIYLGYCIVNKMIIDYKVQQVFSANHISRHRYFTTPAPLQNWLWFVVAATDSGYQVGYISVFDNYKRPVLNYFPRNVSLLDNAPDQKKVQQLLRFSQGFYTVEKHSDTLLFNDLRFGQVIGWADSSASFAFHFYLSPDIDNTLVVQRGRFARWTWETTRQFWRRIQGK